MKFSEGVELLQEYRYWRIKANEKNDFKIPYNPETFISFLRIKGYEIKRSDVEKTAKWIPVSERLPEKMGTYLVTLEYKEHGIGVTTLWFYGAEIGWDLRVGDIVLAWMPLPEPYTESEG